MLKFRRKEKYLLSGRHSFFSSWFMRILLILAFLALLSIPVLQFRKSRLYLPSVSSLYRAWNEKDYRSVYDNSGKILTRRPLDGEVLALHGFSSYYLYNEQTDPETAQNFLADSIVSLRNAWYRVSDAEKPRIAYILGKCYYQRGYYYADLAVKYLNFAYSAGLKFDDLAEFRGLSASLLGDYQTSIASFTEALAIHPSDLLLFTLARNYLKAGEPEKAKQYLYETLRTTGDELLMLKCRVELANAFLGENKLAEAQSEFDAILEKDPNSADAHYGLGVIYETQGDLIRARAEWRKAIRANPVHPGARAKLEI